MGIDLERCVEILHQMGMLAAGRSALLNLSSVPHGLNAEDTERAIREHAARRSAARRERRRPYEIHRLAARATGTAGGSYFGRATHRSVQIFEGTARQS